MTIWRSAERRQSQEPVPEESRQGRERVPEEPRLLTVRGAVILTASAAMGIGAGVLTLGVPPHPATAIITGVTVFAGAVRFLDWAIGPS